MAMKVSLMTVDCVPSPNITFDIIGYGLVADSDLKLFSSNGVPLTYTVVTATSYHIRLNNITPSPTAAYVLKYGEKILFEAALICPSPSVSGIYFIDSSRKQMRDNYNNFNKKIPDPTIRTAYIGE